jgi:hypothetical protein
MTPHMQRANSLRVAHEALVATQSRADAPQGRLRRPNITLRSLRAGQKGDEVAQLPIFTWWLEIEPGQDGGAPHGKRPPQTESPKTAWTVSLQLRDIDGLGCTLVVVCCAANEHQARRAFAARHGTQYALMAQTVAGIVIDSVTEPVVPAIALNMMKMLAARREDFSFCARADYDLPSSQPEGR